MTKKQRLLVALALAVLIHAAPGVGAEDPWTVDDVVQQFKELKHHGEWMGFHLGIAGDSYGGPDHNQGVARIPNVSTPYLLVTRSVAHSNEPTVMIVRMGTRRREPHGERLRSNRLYRDAWTVNTWPSLVDKVRISLGVPIKDWPTGAEGYYKHVGSTQIVDNIAPLPLEQPDRSDRDPKGKIIFVDLSHTVETMPNPEPPTQLEYEMDFDHGAACIGLTKLPDGYYLMALTWGNGNRIRFFKSNVKSLRDLDTVEGGAFVEWDDIYASDVIGAWPTQGTEICPIVRPCFKIDSTFQTINFLKEPDGDLYLAGFFNTGNLSPVIRGDDLGFLYGVGGYGGQPWQVTLEELHDKHFYTADPFYSTGYNGNFNAGTGVYVSPTGELILYAVDHYNDGPHPDGEDGIVTMSEFRHRDVYRPYSPNWAPNVDAGGAYEVDEGSSVLLDGTGTTAPHAEAWAELYQDTGYKNRSVVFDVPDREKENWENFKKLDDEFDVFKEGFNDHASSARWFAPPGAKFTIYKDTNSGGDSYELEGTGKPERISLHSGEVDMADVVSSIDFDGPVRGELSELHWDIYTDPPLGTLAYPMSWTPRYDAIEGTYFDGEPSVVEVSLLVKSNLLQPNGLRTRSIDVAEIVVHNLAPVVQIDRIEDQNGDVIGAALPVLLEALEYDLVGSYTDAGVEDTHTGRIDWGDGSANTSDQAGFEMTDSLGGVVGTVRVPHAYMTKGTYSIRLTIVDDDLDFGLAGREVEVVDAAGATRLCIERLLALLENPGLGQIAAQAIASALAALQGNQDGGAMNGALDFFEAGLTNAALQKVKQAMAYLDSAQAVQSSLTPSLEPVQILMTFAAKSTALKEIAKAEAAPRSRRDAAKIDEVHRLIAEGDAAHAAGHYTDAALAYQRACRVVQGIIQPEECLATLRNHRVRGSEIQASCFTLTVGPSLEVMPTGQLTLRAADSVGLVDGVSVASGGTLTIGIDPGLGL